MKSKRPFRTPSNCGQRTSDRRAHPRARPTEIPRGLEWPTTPLPSKPTTRVAPPVPNSSDSSEGVPRISLFSPVHPGVGPIGVPFLPRTSTLSLSTSAPGANFPWRGPCRLSLELQDNRMRCSLVEPRKVVRRPDTEAYRGEEAEARPEENRAVAAVEGNADCVADHLGVTTTRARALRAFETCGTIASDKASMVNAGRCAVSLLFEVPAAEEFPVVYVSAIGAYLPSSLAAGECSPTPEKSRTQSPCTCAH